MYLLHISLWVAFLGGALSLLPACGPALVPTFFALSFKNPSKLVFSTALFSLGFALVFLPFVLGVAALGDFLIFHRVWLFRGAGLFLILNAVWILFGGSFQFFRFSHRPKIQSLWSPLVLGLVMGLTSTACSAPIFGGVLAVASTAGMGGAFWLAVFFFLGMWVPLIVLAILIQRFGFVITRFFVYRVEMTVFSRQFSWTVSQILSGLIFFFLGVSLVFGLGGFVGDLPQKSGLLDWILRMNQRLLSN
jgi:cytochrome c biogenesis protein CcdA